MNRKVQRNYEALASVNGLRLDPQSGVMYGNVSGYSVQLYASSDGQPYMLTMSFAVTRNAEPLTKEECKSFSKQYKQIMSLRQQQNLVLVSLRAYSKQEKLQENVKEALSVSAAFLRQNGFTECCQACGQTTSTYSCMVGNAAMQVCPSCYQNISQSENMKLQQKEQASENLIGGIVGAILGSLLGAVCILLISQLGYVAAISGVVMAVCTLKGYELLGKKLTTRGVVISVVLMCVVTFLTNRLDWAILVSQELDWGISYSYQAVPYLIEEEIIEVGSYYGNLIMIYLFVIVGAVPMVRNILRNQKNAGRIYRMGGTEL